MSRRSYSKRLQLQRQSVEVFFSDPVKWDIAYDFIAGDKSRTFSRRFWEFFVTDYCRTHICQYYIRDPSNGEQVMFNIYLSMQTMLYGLHKKQMDPFVRSNHAMRGDGIFEFGHGDKIAKTNVPQLVFFRWAIVNQVVNYVIENEAAIRKDMSRVTQERRQVRDSLEVDVKSAAEKSTASWGDEEDSEEFRRKSSFECIVHKKRRRTQKATVLISNSVKVRTVFDSPIVSSASQ